MPGKQTRRQTAEAPAELTPAVASGLFAAWNSDLTDRITGLGSGVIPDRLDACQQKARYFWETNGFVRGMLQTRIDFYDFGCRIQPADKKDAAAITSWATAVERVFNQYRKDAWQEFMVQDVVVGLWRENGKPVTFPVDKCKYTDAFGEEKLIIQHKLSETMIDGMKGLSPAEKATLKRGQEITLTKDNAAGKIFQFDVLKRARLGDGFGYPALKSMFTALSQFESLEVGDNLYAGLGRDVIMQLKIGHEIKNGPFAGNKIHFCTQAKADNAVKQLKGKKGVILIVTNFDQSFEYPRPDAKHFDGKKYDGVIRRLMLWAQPVAQIILERALNPNLMQVFKHQAIADRTLMAGHLNAVLQGMNPPAPVRVAWSNRCFADSRLFADLLKFNYQSGAISQETVREDSGYDDRELERKEKEGKLPAAQKEPAYDPAHSKPNEGPGGRKPGSPDNP